MTNAKYQMENGKWNLPQKFAAPLIFSIGYKKTALERGIPAPTMLLQLIFKDREAELRTFSEIKASALLSYTSALC
jgi:hypothetical protein